MKALQSSADLKGKDEVCRFRQEKQEDGENRLPRWLVRWWWAGFTPGRGSETEKAPSR